MVDDAPFKVTVPARAVKCAAVRPVARDSDRIDVGGYVEGPRGDGEITEKGQVAPERFGRA